jgi:hypothetical protein
MVMKKIFALVLMFVTLLSGCKSKDEIVPTEIWNEGCGELAILNDEYRLSGLCCEYVTFPKTTFKKGHTRIVSGTYHTFTGAGFSHVPVPITLKVAEDGNQLTMSFTILTLTKTYNLVPGGAKMICDCFCD